jgi:cyclopropane-fatty-acyl-phospholipid synthase
MLIFSIEQSPATYFADFSVYGVGIAALAVVVGLYAPQSLQTALSMWVLAGLAFWTLIEYGVHRFVLHRVPPFAAMHEMHHRNPRAYIGTPTIVTALLFVVMVFLPALWAAGVWVACAFTLGVLLGYMAYSVMHHAAHHWRSSGAWLKRRKHVHGLHHQFGPPGFYGVTTSIWDHVFRTTRTNRATQAPRSGRTAQLFKLK